MSERTKMIPFSPPDISEAEINEVAEALRSGWITTGPRTKKLEKEIAEWIGTEKCVCLNSQTACAEMALRILGVGEGDEIIERKKNLFRPSNEIQKAIGRIAVCADTAHAFGAKRHGKMIGSIADFSSFSFHAVKNFTTAEGGALTWRNIEGISNDDIYHQLQLLSLHGQSKDALAKTKLGAWEYDIVGTWYKCNMTDVVAAIGLAQFERYPGMLARRKEIIGRYDAAFKPLGVETLDHYNAEHESSGHLYITRVPGITPEQRNEIIIKMAEQGVACNVHYKPLPMHTAYKKLGFDIKDYPNAYAHFANEITLPLHTCLTDDDVAYVIEKYTEILKEYI